MKKVNEQKKSAFAYNILSGGLVIYQSWCYCYREDALKYGREDAMLLNSHGENVEYDVVRTVY
jgi:hypothetical protein